ncbi:MAG: hypothetical protein U0670_09860 [Anaerolineae bacterium]
MIFQTKPPMLTNQIDPPLKRTANKDQSVMVGKSAFIPSAGGCTWDNFRIAF